LQTEAKKKKKKKNVMCVCVQEFYKNCRLQVQIDLLKKEVYFLCPLPLTLNFMIDSFINTVMATSIAMCITLM